MPAVLFVCTANVCRSPMAAALFSAQLARRAAGVAAEEWTISSAGTWAVDGFPATAHALEAVAAKGIDLAPHRSRLLNEASLDAADLVLVMTRSHREAILAECPSAAGKVYLLSQMVGQTFDVRDPYGESRMEYEYCADHLQGLIEQGFERILELARLNHQ
ncbi:MAG: low molecular weight protein arginine phosphatase [Chloroflexi bacterium]|nr:low molecular weight protein arginine phosphatase [Chloroflexota bacterium]